MYSRFQEQPKKPLRVPDHYSGCAFPSPAYPPPKAPVSEEQEEAKKTSIPTQETPAIEPAIAAKEPKEASKELSLKEPDRVAGAFPSLFGTHPISFPLGMSFDELLLIGLILLLSRSETESDIVLWLALLLFCK